MSKAQAINALAVSFPGRAFLLHHAPPVVENLFAPEEILLAEMKGWQRYSKVSQLVQLQDIPEGATVLPMLPVYTFNADQHTLKARFTAMGNLEARESIPASRCPVTPWWVSTSILSLSACLGRSVSSFDIRNAFLNALPMHKLGPQWADRAVYVWPPSCADTLGQAAKLQVVPFGCSDAPLSWFLSWEDFLLEQGWDRSLIPMSLSLPLSTGRGVMGGHVDDMLLSLPKQEDTPGVMAPIREKYDLSEEHPISGTPVSHLGKKLRATPEGGFEVSMPLQFDTAFSDTTGYISALGELGWPAQSVAPYALYRYCAAERVSPSPQDIEQLRKYMDALTAADAKGETPSLSFTPIPTQDLTWVCYADSGMPTPTKAARTGHCIFMVDVPLTLAFPEAQECEWVSLPGNLIHAASNRVKHTAKSNSETYELLAIARAAEQALKMQESVRSLFREDCPPSLSRPVLVFNDHYNVQGLLESECIPQSFPLLQELQYVKELIAKSLIRVKWVPGKHTPAHELTNVVPRSASILADFMATGRVEVPVAPGCSLGGAGPLGGEGL
jgi:hypothetical protein